MQGFTGNAYKLALWNMATATTVPQFERAKSEMDKLDHMEVKWLEARDPASWCRAFFTPQPKCDVVE